MDTVATVVDGEELGSLVRVSHAELGESSGMHLPEHWVGLNITVPKYAVEFDDSSIAQRLYDGPEFSIRNARWMTFGRVVPSFDVSGESDELRIWLALDDDPKPTSLAVERNQSYPRGLEVESVQSFAKTTFDRRSPFIRVGHAS
ncbi:hypothetical protein [Umezawaea sp. NPDC059074]|uniref:hypothetical protein n=1 Tax=Umezawaea sp. NPDC059074 TaxID=3346716 RepID=UPI0036B20B82